MNGDEWILFSRADLMNGVGHEILAGAGFTADQYRDVGHGGLTDLFIDILHGGRGTDHVVKRGFCDILFQQKVHAEPRSVVQRRIDQHPEFAVFHRQPGILAGARLQSRECGGKVLSVGKNDELGA